MVGDVDQQILLDKGFEDVARDGRHDLQGGAGHVALGDHDAGVEFVFVDVMGEGAHLFDADGGLGAEFDPNGADVRGRIRLFGGGDRCVFLKHGSRGAGGEVHFLAAAMNFVSKFCLRMCAFLCARVHEQRTLGHR